MNKERQVIDSQAIVVFNHDVTAIQLNKILKNFHGDVVIKGSLLLNDNLNIACNVFVDGDISGEDKVTSINIKGDLYIHATNCHHITVSGDLYCLDLNKEYTEVKIKSEDICVGGTLYCEGDIIARNIEVGESLECNIEKIKINYGVLNIFIARTNTHICFN